MFRPLLSLCLALLVSAPAHADNIQTFRAAKRDLNKLYQSHPVTSSLRLQHQVQRQKMAPTGRAAATCRATGRAGLPASNGSTWCPPGSSATSPVLAGRGRKNCGKSDEFQQDGGDMQPLPRHRRGER